MPGMTMPAPDPRIPAAPRSAAPSPGPPPTAYLEVRSGDGETRRFLLHRRQGVVIGTAPLCDLRLTDAYVSRRHAGISPSGGRFLVDALGSANGTTLNGSRLHGQEQLRPGDVIGVGRSRLTFASPGAGLTPPGPAQPRRAPGWGSTALIAGGAGVAVAGAVLAYAAVVPGLSALLAGLALLAAGWRRAGRALTR